MSTGSGEWAGQTEWGWPSLSYQQLKRRYITLPTCSVLTHPLLYTHTHAHTHTKVWYHTCPSRGKSCRNTQLVENGGCAIWYNEPQVGGVTTPTNTMTHTLSHAQYLLDVQEHLGVTIPETTASFSVPESGFDGKVVYGEKRKEGGVAYKGHIAQLAPSVAQLAEMESLAQSLFLKMQAGQKWTL